MILNEKQNNISQIEIIAIEFGTFSIIVPNVRVLVDLVMQL